MNFYWTVNTQLITYNTQESVDAIKEFNISSIDKILHATTYPVGNEARTVLELSLIHI